MKTTPQPSPPKPWQKALKGKARIVGDIFTIGLEWEASQPGTAKPHRPRTAR